MYGRLSAESSFKVCGIAGIEDDRSTREGMLLTPGPLIYLKW